MTTPAGPVPARSPWSPSGWALVVGAFVAGFAQGPLAAVGTGFDHLPGDRIDGRFNQYVLEHGYRWTRGEVRSFWDLPVCYPARRLTAYSDAHLGSLPLFAGLRAVGLSSAAAYQVWFLVFFPLNYAAAAWAARRLGGGPVAASVSGVVFAFAAAAVGHTLNCGHTQLGPRFLVPPAVLLAHRWLLAPTVRRLALLAGCLVLQAYLTIYIAYFAGLLVLAVWAATAVLRQDAVDWRRLRAGWWHWLIVAAGAGAILVPLVGPHLRAGADHPPAPARTLYFLSPTPWAWLLAPDLSRQAGWMHRVFPPPLGRPGLSELFLFPGWLPLGGLVAAAVLARRRPDAPAVLAAAGLAVAVGVTRVNDFCLYDPVFRLPGGGSVRVMSRVVLVLLFPAGLAAGFLLERLAGNRRWLGAALVGLAVADQSLVLPGGPGGRVWAAHRIPVAGANAESDRLADAVRRQRPDARVLFVFPKPDETDLLTSAGVRQVDCMWAAAALGVPTVNGYSGYWPTGWELFRGYDSLLGWLPPEHRAGLVVVGEPADAATPTAATARAAFPPLAWPAD